MNALQKLLAGMNQAKEEPIMSVGEPAQTSEVEEVSETQEVIEKPDVTTPKVSREPSVSPEQDNQYDALKKMRDNITAYDDRLAKKQKPNDVMNWLTGIGKGANVLSKSMGTSFGEVENWQDTQNRANSANKKEDLNQLQELQKLYNNYQANTKKTKKDALTAYQKVQDDSKKEDRKLKLKLAKMAQKSKDSSAKPTEGEKVVDRVFAKLYTTWNAGGKADYEVNSKIFKDAIGDLKSGKISTGSLDGMGSRLPGYRSDTREAEDIVRKAINGMLRATLGSQFTEGEGERIFAQTFDPFKDEKANVAAMEYELAKLEKRKDAIQDMSAYYNKGSTLSGYEPSLAKSGIEEVISDDVVRRRTKDGRTAIFNAETKEFIKYEK